MIGWWNNKLGRTTTVRKHMLGAGLGLIPIAIGIVPYEGHRRGSFAGGQEGSNRRSSRIDEMTLDGTTD